MRLDKLCFGIGIAIALVGSRILHADDEDDFCDRIIDVLAIDGRLDNYAVSIECEISRKTTDRPPNTELKTVVIAVSKESKSLRCDASGEFLADDSRAHNFAFRLIDREREKKKEYFLGYLDGPQYVVVKTEQFPEALVKQKVSSPLSLIFEGHNDQPTQELWESGFFAFGDTFSPERIISVSGDKENLHGISRSSNGLLLYEITIPRKPKALISTVHCYLNVPKLQGFDPNAPGKSTKPFSKSRIEWKQYGALQLPVKIDVDYNYGPSNRRIDYAISYRIKWAFDVPKKVFDTSDINFPTGTNTGLDEMLFK